MAQEKYDIFISYRRKDENGKEWGTSIARNILQALEDRGYKGRVFFDHNKIGPEDFEKKILGAIKQAKVFLCVLTKNAMDNCVNEGDWVRREICKALESGLNIIFLNPDNEFNHKLLPKDFPKELDIVKTQNSLEIRSGQKFEVDIDDMIKRYINEIVPCRIVSLPKLPASVPMGTLRIKTDLDCRIFNYGKEIGVAKVGEFISFDLPVGDNLLKYVGFESNEDCYEEKIPIVKNHQKLVCVELLDKYNTRKIADRKLKARNDYLLCVPDEEFDFFIESDKLGYKLKSTGEIVIPAKYDSGYSSFHEGLAVVKLNGKEGFIDKTGKEVIPLKYDSTQIFREGLAGAKLNGKWGFINKYDEIVVPFIYCEVENFSEGVARVRKNDERDKFGKYGYVDRNGKEITSFKYELSIYSGLGDFENGFAIVFKDGRYGFINKLGREITPLQYSYVWNFENGFAIVDKDGDRGCIDVTGREIIPCEYEYILRIQDGLIKAGKGTEDIYFNIDTGEKFTNGAYALIDDFYDKLARVLKNGKWGYIDVRGNEIVPLKYDFIRYFRDGLAGVELNGKWGFVDKKGEEVIPIIYDSISDFNEGKAKVRVGGFLFGARFYIDKNGNKVE